MLETGIFKYNFLMLASLSLGHSVWFVMTEKLETCVCDNQDDLNLKSCSYVDLSAENNAEDA